MKITINLLLVSVHELLHVLYSESKHLKTRKENIKMKNITKKEYEVIKVIVTLDTTPKNETNELRNIKTVQFNYLYERLNNTKYGNPCYKIILCGLHKGLEIIIKDSYYTINETVERLLINELKEYTLNEYNYIHNIPNSI